MPCCAFPLESKPKSRFSAPIGAFEERFDLHRPQYRGQVDVDAGLLELAAPGLCGGAQRVSAHLALRHRGRHRVESTALEMLHLAAFLIGGDDQLVAARSIALQRVSGGLGCGCAVVPVADEHHGTDMACADEGAEIGRIAACEHRCHDELPGPFIETHRGDGAARLGRGGSHRLPSDAPEISAVSVWGPCRGSAVEEEDCGCARCSSVSFCWGRSIHHAVPAATRATTQSMAAMMVGAELGRGLLPPCLICCILICTSVGHHV